MKLSERLSEFLSEKEEVQNESLTHDERAIFRSLKAAGERATKGREIDEFLFEVKIRGDQPTFQMLIEGRHAMLVGRQVKKRFLEHNDLRFVDLLRTKKGVKVVLVPEETCKN